MPLSQELMNRIKLITKEVARSTGNKLQPTVLIHKAKNSMLAQRLGLLQSLSVFLFSAVFILALVVIFVYLSLPDEAPAFSAEELQQLIDNRLKEEVAKNAHLLERGDLAVSWAVENAVEGENKEIRGIKVFKSRKGSSGSILTELNEKGSLADLSTKADLDASKGVNGVGLRGVGDFMSFGKRELISKLRTSK